MSSADKAKGEEAAKLVFDGFVQVICNGRQGVLDILEHRIMDETAKEMAPREFEKLAGLGATKKWKESVKVRGSESASNDSENVSVERFLMLLETVDVSLWFPDRDDEEDLAWPQIKIDSQLMEPNIPAPKVEKTDDGAMDVDDEEDAGAVEDDESDEEV